MSIWSEFDQDAYRKLVRALFQCLSPEQVEVHVLCVRTFDPRAAREAVTRYFQDNRGVPCPKDIVDILRPPVPNDRIQPPRKRSPVAPLEMRAHNAGRLVSLWQARREAAKLRELIR